MEKESNMPVDALARRGIRRIGRRTGRRTTGGRSVSKGLSAMGGKGRKVPSQRSKPASSSTYLC